MREFDYSKIKEARINKKLTQRELAEEIGVTFPTISRWESGERIPHANYIPFLADALGVKIKYFYPKITIKELL